MHENRIAQCIADQSFPVLDHGSVRLIDVMGSDQSIIENARRSYADDSKRVSDDRTLARYLVRHNHGGPLEFAQTVIEYEMPLFTFGHWVRHRTGSFNVFSQRYSKVPDKFYRTEPDAWRLQSENNKQGSDGFLEVSGEQGEYNGNLASNGELALHRTSVLFYNNRIDAGIAREQARKDLPQSVYTQFRMRLDLRNMFGLLRQRLAPDAQQETRLYAECVFANIVKPLFPLFSEAFEDYQLHAMKLSLVERSALSSFVRMTKEDRDEYQEVTLTTFFPNKRERAECRAKLVRLGIITEKVDA